MVITNLADLPVTLRIEHIAAIYDVHWKTVQRLVRLHSARLPQPAFIKPYRWRKSDVVAHYEKTTVSEQIRDHWQQKATARRARTR